MLVHLFGGKKREAIISFGSVISLLFSYINDVIGNARSATFRSLQCIRLHFSIIVYAMGVDYVVIGFDMEVQPLVTHNAA